jgi:(E)-4-hydroxy-3-methylbut-2-enyl-diphosphate synthase
VSLTLPFDDKGQEITVGREILDDIAHGRFRSVPASLDHGLNIISCPSCSRVENEKFVELAQDVKAMSEYAKNYDVTIAVMGCRVNGPGETDDADIGMWCGPLGVNLKRGEETVGHFPYETVLTEVRQLLDELIAGKTPQPAPAAVED